VRGRIEIAALILAVALTAGGLLAALGLLALGVAALLAVLVAVPAARVPDGLRSRTLRLALAWGIGLLAVALGAAGDDGPLRTVCGDDGACGTGVSTDPAAAFVAYLGGAAAFGVWALLRRSRTRAYATDHSSPVR
jgi:hypothetical protein